MKDRGKLRADVLGFAGFVALAAAAHIAIYAAKLIF